MLKFLFLDHDAAEPSGNSISAMNLLRLSILTEKSEYRSKIYPLFVAFAGRLYTNPRTITTLVSALTLHFDSITSVNIGHEYLMSIIFLNVIFFRFILLVNGMILILKHYCL